MNYIHIETLQYPVSEQDIRVLHPNVSFPTAFLPPAEYNGVFETPCPDFDVLTQYAIESAPVLTDKGHWEQQWEVVALDVDVATANQTAALTQTRINLIASNNAQYEDAIGKMTREYPATEITTWERQRAEAIAWDADVTATTPWIDIAASARGLDRDEYLARTLAKVNAFAMVSAYLTGRRQGIDDQIKAATTSEQLASITIDYTLPGA